MSAILALFDMDGTLLDSMQYWRGILIELMEKNGYELPDSVKDQLQHLRHGAGVDLIRRMMVGDDNLPLTPEDIHAGMLEHYRHDISLKPGTVEKLRETREAGAKIVVATASPIHLCMTALSHCGILDLVDDIITPQTFGCGKEKPEYFEKVMERYGVGAEDVTLYEDAYYSALTASGLGIRVVAIEDACQAANKEELLALADEYYTDGWLTRVK